jgi:hypothetical protein
MFSKMHHDHCQIANEDVDVQLRLQLSLFIESIKDRYCQFCRKLKGKSLVLTLKMWFVQPIQLKYCIQWRSNADLVLANASNCLHIEMASQSGISIQGEIHELWPASRLSAEIQTFWMSDAVEWIGWSIFRSWHFAFSRESLQKQYRSVDWSRSSFRSLESILTG